MQFTDAEFIPPVIAISISLSVLIYINSKISDARADLNWKISDAKETLGAEAAKLRSEMEMLRRSNNALQIHVLEHHK